MITNLYGLFLPPVLFLRNGRKDVGGPGGRNFLHGHGGSALWAGRGAALLRLPPPRLRPPDRCLQFLFIFLQKMYIYPFAEQKQIATDAAEILLLNAQVTDDWATQYSV